VYADSAARGVTKIIFAAGGVMVQRKDMTRCRVTAQNAAQRQQRARSIIQRQQA